MFKPTTLHLKCLIKAFFLAFLTYYTRQISCLSVLTHQFPSAFGPTQELYPEIAGIIHQFYYL